MSVRNGLYEGDVVIDSNLDLWVCNWEQGDQSWFCKTQNGFPLETWESLNQAHKVERVPVKALELISDLKSEVAELRASQKKIVKHVVEVRAVGDNIDIEDSVIW